MLVWEVGRVGIAGLVNTAARTLLMPEFIGSSGVGVVENKISEI